jgi:hypothetical protein
VKPGHTYGVGINAFAQRVGPQEWEERAACREVDPELMFPNRVEGREAVAAARVCARCPVVDECHELAQTLQPISGVWAFHAYREVKGPVKITPYCQIEDCDRLPGADTGRCTKHQVAHKKRRERIAEFEARGMERAREWRARREGEAS